MPELLDSAAVDAAITDMPPWARDADVLRASFETPDFRAAISLVAAIADQAEDMNHHPDIDIRYNTVNLALSTHSAGGITSADLELARRIGKVAAAAGARPAG